MDPGRWRQIERLYDQAQALSAGERAAFLAEACADDEALRRELQALLDGSATAEGFLAVPAVIGQRLGVYQIQERIGAGGMGEVYRARDTRLGRDVAIKILPPGLTADPGRLARFEREARALAALNHPNIATIHGVEEAEGILALVMELVEGETLAERIRGPEGLPSGSGRPSGLPVAEALRIALQLADAIDAAHEKGIIHRDLKPANIKITPAGTVKVLDFGLAKTVAGAGADPHALTIIAGGTREGLIVGTAAYLSPEQARGQVVDKRTDIWAFGCVFFEMLAGRAAFAANTVSDTIAAILEHEPDWHTLPRQTPPAIRRLLQRCLEKDPKHRVRDIGDTRLELDDALTADLHRRDLGELKHATDLPTPSSPLASSTGNVSKRERLAWSVAGASMLLLFVALVAAVLYVRRAPSEPLVTRLEVVTPPTPDSQAFALSPDGRQLVFIARVEGRPRLWLRPLDQATARQLTGTDGASAPFWAPDGRAIGFFADGDLRRINLTDGVVQVLAGASAGRGGTWNQEGTIVFAPNPTGGLMGVAATGGTPVAVTQPASGQGSHRWPQFLPDGRRFIFVVGVGRPDMRGVFVGSLDGGKPTRILEDETAAVYAPPDQLLVVRDGVLMALRFDPVRGIASGDPVAVAQNVGATAGLFRGVFSVSANGVLAHRPAGAQRRQLTWVDRSGRQIGTVGPPDETAMANPALAPDGRFVAVNRVVKGDIDVWLIDVARGISSRLSFEPSIENLPLWSRDGRRVIFRSTRNGPYDLFEKPANGSGDEQLLLADTETKAPLDWSPDGRTLLYAALDPQTGTADLWALPTGGDRKPFPVVQTGFDEADGQFSPDGRWLAYESNESGRFEIYVQAFPGPSSKWQMSLAGGSQPIWRRDGKELFYVATDGHLMAVPIVVGSDSRTLEVGTPLTLFAGQLANGANVFGPGGAAKSQYVVTPDGRFLMNLALDETNPPPIAVVLNWNSELEK